MKMIDDKLSEYEINYIEPIGSGSHGIVYEGIHKETNMKYVIKRIQLNDNNLDEKYQFIQEAYINSKLISNFFIK